MIKEKMVNLLYAIYNLLKFYFTFIGQMDSLYVLHILMFFIMLERQILCVSGLIKHAFSKQTFFVIITYLFNCEQYFLPES